MAAGERIIKVIDTVQLLRNKPDAIELPPVQGAVDFNDVHFYYEKNIPIIKDLNLHIDPKKRIAIIGYTGAGKTTIITYYAVSMIFKKVPSKWMDMICEMLR